MKTPNLVLSAGEVISVCSNPGTTNEGGIVDAEQFARRMSRADMLRGTEA